MKKVMIITLYGYENYGNKLQNYALQETIQQLGYEVETLKNTFKDKSKNTILAKIKRISAQKIIKKILKKKKINDESYEYNKIKYKKLKEFNDIYIKNSNFTIKNNNPRELNEMYDYFVIGSDQIWNPSVSTPFEINFGMFADKNKKISYAASFGVEKIPNMYRKIYKQGLKGILNISVREEQGIKIINEIYEEQAAIVVLDPTMLLSAEKWRKISRLPNKTKNKKYILMYFLGQISKERHEMLNKVANERNCIIIDVLKKQEIVNGVAGVEEFLALIDNAEIIFTDSFHACVFSILFKKDFYVLEREGIMSNMNSRINTLLQKFLLQNRKINNYDEIIKCMIDYSKTDEILEKEKEKSMNFLKRALDIKD